MLVLASGNTLSHVVVETDPVGLTKMTILALKLFLPLLYVYLEYKHDVIYERPFLKEWNEQLQEINLESEIEIHHFKDSESLSVDLNENQNGL